MTKLNSLSRRAFLKNSLFSISGPLLLKPLSFLDCGDSSEILNVLEKDLPKVPIIEKKLSFYNIHTGESLKNVVFWAGHYIQENLTAINKIFRDHICGQVYTIDMKLLELLHKLHEKLELKEKTFHLISGFRSVTTNNALRENSSGVALHSQHCIGRAADISLPGMRTVSQIAQAAKLLKLGGVGTYSQFVHVDTGVVRSW
jgi:uncharacterized protein YcbK (DUF882 family)